MLSPRMMLLPFAQQKLSWEHSSKVEHLVCPSPIPRFKYYSTSVLNFIQTNKKLISPSFTIKRTREAFSQRLGQNSARIYSSVVWTHCMYNLIFGLPCGPLTPESTFKYIVFFQFTIRFSSIPILKFILILIDVIQIILQKNLNW